MFCPQCGAKIPDGARFCVACGFDVAGAVSPGASQREPSATPVSQEHVSALEPLTADQRAVVSDTPAGKNRSRTPIIVIGAIAVALVAGVALAFTLTAGAPQGDAANSDAAQVGGASAATEQEDLAEGNEPEPEPEPEPIETGVTVSNFEFRPERSADYHSIMYLEGNIESEQYGSPTLQYTVTATLNNHESYPVRVIPTFSADLTYIDDYGDETTDRIEIDSADYRVAGQLISIRRESLVTGEIVLAPEQKLDVVFLFCGSYQGDDGKMYNIALADSEGQPCLSNIEIKDLNFEEFSLGDYAILTDPEDVVSIRIDEGDGVYDAWHIRGTFTNTTDERISSAEIGICGSYNGRYISQMETGEVEFIKPGESIDFDIASIPEYAADQIDPSLFSFTPVQVAYIPDPK